MEISDIEVVTQKAHTDYFKLVQQLEDSTKNQRIEAAIESMEQLDPDEIPRALKPKFANLARRLNRPILALKILWSEILERSDHSPDFLFELVSTLRRVGLINQARLWLDRMPQSPRSLQERAFHHIQQWEYREAKDILISLLESKNLDDKINPSIVKVNLMACHLFVDEPDRALEIAQQLPFDMMQTHRHLYLNSLELKGQAQFAMHNKEQAEQTLNQAKDLVNSKSDITSLLIQKWITLLHYSNGKITLDSKEFKEIRQQARATENWETLRDLDYQLGCISGEREMIIKVLFGTPFPAYKTRILRNLNVQDLPHNFLWRDLRFQEANMIFDPLRYFHPVLRFGQTEHRLVCLLLSDQYRPFSVVRLFDLLFPNELYNPFTSNGRIHNLIGSLRETLQKLGLPLEIFSTEGGYRVRPTQQVAFMISPRMTFTDQSDLILNALRASFRLQAFSREDAETQLPFSKNQWKRLLRNLLEGNSLVVDGRGKSTKYRIAS